MTSEHQGARVSKSGEPMPPEHPGIGCSTSLHRLSGDHPEQGGAVIFYPSGRTAMIGWRQVQQITPTLDAAKKYAAAFGDALMRLSQQGDAHAADDFDRTNWASVTAAIQRIILDWNEALSKRVSLKLAHELQRPRKIRH